VDKGLIMATNIFRIPFTAVPQRFDITLAGRALTMVARWNGECPAWSFDLIDAVTTETLINNMDIVTGCDLLEQHSYLGIGGRLFAFTDGDPGAPPTEENLGTDSNLFFVTGS
jgi:spore coat polysaccharide biosynthesis protein SpsF (cytidylyltransferase family)